MAAIGNRNPSETEGYYNSSGLTLVEKFADQVLRGRATLDDFQERWRPSIAEKMRTLQSYCDLNVVCLNGKQFEFRLHCDEKISKLQSQLKASLEAYCNYQKDIPEFSLLLNKKELDDTKTLAEYGLQQCGRYTLEANIEAIAIPKPPRCPSLTPVQLEMRDLQERSQIAKATEALKQYIPEWVEDALGRRACGPRKGEICSAAFEKEWYKQLGYCFLNISCPNGQTVKYWEYFNKTILDLKLSIASKQMLFDDPSGSPSLKLFLNGEELDITKTFQDYRFSPGGEYKIETQFGSAE